jgi:hypothetical protein
MVSTDITSTVEKTITSRRIYRYPAAIQKHSVGLCQGKYQLDRASLALLAGVSGRGFHEGAACLMEEVW